MAHRFDHTPGGCAELAKDAAWAEKFLRLNILLNSDRRVQNIPSILMMKEHYSTQVFGVQPRKHSPALPQFSSPKMLRNVTYFVEPLFGLLRDPFSIPCAETMRNAAGEQSADLLTGSTQDKRHILLRPLSPKVISFVDGSSCVTFETLPMEPWGNSIHSQLRVLIFDLGASLFNGWGGMSDAAAGHYFHEQLARSNVQITHYWGFELSPQEPRKVWDAVPPDMRGHYTFVNIGVTADPQSPDYPWLILMQNARPEDYVVIKVDIDTSAIENPLVDLLLASPELLALVDEFLYEHHVGIAEMGVYWGNIPELSLQDSYNMFSKFRRAGIASHSWP
jgi:hypothetical protein